VNDILKVLVVNNIDVKGGAYRASYNIHKALLKAGIESSFYDYTHSGPKFIRKIHHSLDRFVLRKYPDRNNPDFFSPAGIGINIRKDEMFKEIDIINLHWINGGFMSLKSIEWIMGLGKPVVWTMHDFWPISGGCHLNRGCIKFKGNCGACPVLGSYKENDLSRNIWEKKNMIYQNALLHWVTVSDWFLSQAKQSSLLKNGDIYKIYNAIDTDIFRPHEKLAVRKELNLPADRFIILTGGFGITKDPNKGFSDLLMSLKILKEKHSVPEDKICVVVFGNADESELKKSAFKIMKAGIINNDEKLSKYYSAADVFICSSKQETGPTTILESMSCGTPVISYNVGVVPEIVINNKNGLICSKNEPGEIADGIFNLIRMEKEKRSQFGINARNMIALNCSYEITGNKYLELFLKIRGTNLPRP
jgi:glycosyltransferase involved in cell wall biosynthesis